METALERGPYFDTPEANKMETEELQPFETVTLPPIKIEPEEEEVNAVEEPEVDEDFASSNYLSAPVSPVKDESEVPDESEEEGEVEPSGFLSVSMATVKVEPEEQQEEEEEIEPSRFLSVSLSTLKDDPDQQNEEEEDDDDEEEEEEGEEEPLEPLASVTVSSSSIEDVPSKNVQHPRGEWSVSIDGQQQASGAKRVVSSGVWVPGVEDTLPSSASPIPNQQPKPSPEDRRSGDTPKPFSCEVCAKSFTQKYTLKMHRRVHSEKMPYSILYTLTMESDVRMPSSSGTPIETDNVVPSTSAIPFAVPRTTRTAKTAAQRSREYRKRKAANRTPEEAAAFSKATVERLRRSKQLKSPTLVAPREITTLNTTEQHEQMPSTQIETEDVLPSTSALTVDVPQTSRMVKSVAQRSREYRQRKKANRTPEEVAAFASMGTDAQRAREYRKRKKANRTPEEAAAFARAAVERAQNSKRRRTANLHVASSTVQSATTSSSDAAERTNVLQTRAQQQRACRQRTTATAIL